MSDSVLAYYRSEDSEASGREESLKKLKPDVDSLVSLAAEICETDYAGITLFSPGKEWFYSCHGIELTEIPMEHSFSMHAIRKAGEVMIAEDIRKDERFKDTLPLLDTFPIRFYAGIALITAEGAAAGVLFVGDRSPRTLSKRQQSLLKKIGRQALKLLELVHLTHMQSQPQEIPLRTRENSPDTPAVTSAEIQKREAEITHMRELMRYIVENSNSAIAVFDKDLHFIYVSNRFIKDYNVSDRDIIGRHHYDVFPDLPEKWRAVHQRVLRGESLKEDESLYVRGDGTIAWTRWECIPWYDKHGQVGGIIVYTDVITERKEAEAELLKLSTAVTQSPTNILVTDPEGIIEYVNASFTETTGYTLDDLRGKTPRVLKSDYYDAAFYKDLWCTIKSGKIWRGQFYNRKKNGEHYWGKSTISPVVDEKGTITHYLANEENITDWKKVESELTRFKDVAESGLFSMAISDLHGKIIYINSHFATIHGFEPDELTGKDLTLFHSKEQLVAVEKTLVELQQTGSFGPELIWHTHRDGSTFPMLMRGLLIRDEKEQPEYMAVTAIDMAEYVKKEEELRENEIRLRALSDRIPGGFVYQIHVNKSQSERSFTYLSDGIISLFGITPEEAKKDPSVLYGKVHSEDLAKLNSMEAEALEKMAEFHLDVRYTTDDGQSRWILLSSSPRISDTGGVLWDGIGMDITDLKEAQKQLTESEEKYRIVSENTYHWEFWELPEGELLYNSPSCERVTGYRAEEFIQNPKLIFDIIHPDDLDHYHAHRNVTWNTPAPDSCMFRIYTKTGDLRHISHFCQPAYNDRGELVGIRGTNIDVTEKKEIEEQLIESELYHRSLIQTIPDLVFIMTPDGVFIDFHASSDAKLLLPPKEFLNKNVRDLFPGEIARKQMDAIGTCLAEQRLVSFDYSLGEGDEKRYFSANTVSFREDKILVTTRDITDLKKNLLHIEQLLDLQEKLNDNLRNFTHIVSHNLRIHTANMQGVLELMKESEEELYMNPYVQMLRDSSDSLEETIRDLNDILSIKFNKKLAYEPVPLRKKAEQILETLTPNPSEHGVRIINDLPDDFIIRTVPSYLETILRNLISNSVKYRCTDCDSWVRLTAEKRGNQVAISIEDNGLGIHLERHLPKLFDMYKKFHDSSESKGFGLFITKMQVEVMGGSIEVESTEGVGSMFTVLLPIR